MDRRFTAEEVRAFRGLLYAQHPDGRECWLTVSYRHTVRPDFDTVVMARRPDGTVQRRTDGRHPRYSGVTKKNGWQIEPDFVTGW